MVLPIPGDERLHEVVARVVTHEMVTRIPGARAIPLLPDDLPPVTWLAHQAFPPWVMERRLRFHRALDWYPESPTEAVFGQHPALPPEASLEDWVAAYAG